MARVLVIDNHDSMAWNLARRLVELGAETVVRRNDAIDLTGLRELGPDAIVIGPGAGTPERAGISVATVREFGANIPILGVALGHLCIAAAYGATIGRAAHLMIGRTARITHDGKTIFAGIPSPCEAMRYHALAVAPDSVPETLLVSARTQDGEVMGLRHRRYLVEGVQFDPGSLLTRLLAFLRWTAANLPLDSV